MIFLQVQLVSNHCGIGFGWAYIESLNQSTELVEWDITGTSKYFNLSYSVDNGLTWNKIVVKYYTTIGEYSWNVPNNPSTNCLVKVEDWENGNIVDVSDNVFEILEAYSLILLLFVLILVMSIQRNFSTIGMVFF